MCDVYVAMASARPYRPLREPRTALTDTLLLAEQGGSLDRVTIQGDNANIEVLKDGLSGARAVTMAVPKTR